MNRWWGIKYLLVVWACIVWVAPVVWAQQGQGVTTVYTVGESPIRGDDMSASRQEAIASGLIAAVTDVLTDMVSQETLVSNFQILNETILSQAETYVRDYKVLTEATFNKRHRVMVQVSVSNQSLNSALKKRGIHVGRKPYPRVLFCIAEKESNTVNFQYWWGDAPDWQAGVATTAMGSILKDKGFVLVAPRKGQAVQNDPPELSVPEAVALGQQLRAQVVIVGQAVAEASSNTMGSADPSFRGTIMARAYWVDTSEEVAQSRRSAVIASQNSSAGAKEALQNASLLAGEDLALQIADAWFSRQSGRARTEITVEGVGGQIASFVKFRGALSTMSGVESVQLKEMMPDAAVLTVEYQGSAGTLAEGLMRQNFDTFSINIVETTARMIRLQLVAR
jgi:hypothetical protein